MGEHLLGSCCCLVTQSCLTLRDPMDCSPPGSSVHGISQTRMLEWVVISFFRGSSQVRDQTHVSCIGRQSLYHLSHKGSPSVREFSSVQLSCSVVSDSLRPREPQHARPPCPSPTPGVHPNPCPLSWRCHPTISSKSMSVELVMPSNHLILCHPLLLPSVFPSIRIFS